MRSLVFTILMMGLMAAAVGKANEISLKTFSQWQTDQIQEALAKVTLTKTALQKLSKTADRSELQLQLEQELWQLETAKDLSLNDYAALYLVYQPQNESFQKVAKQLSHKEVTELLIRYTQLLKKSGELRALNHPLQDRSGEGNSGKRSLFHPQASEKSNTLP